MENFVYDIDLKKNAEFTIYHPRRIPHKWKKQVKEELDKMVKLGVIKPIEDATPAVSPMIIIWKNGKLRI